MQSLQICLLALLLPQAASGFVVKGGLAGRVAHRVRLLAKDDGIDSQHTNLLDRRSLIQQLTAASAASALSTVLPMPSIAAGTNGKVVIFGGSGYVGAYVDQILVSRGYSVVSVSRSEPSDQKAKVAAILGSPLDGVEYVSLDASSADLSGVLKGASVVVSCVGAIGSGSDIRLTNGAVNAYIADSAKAAGVDRFVYVSVADELAVGPAKLVLSDYFAGKAEAEAAVIRDFGSDKSLIVRPGIITGAPPGQLRPPGPPNVKPSLVRDVAKAVAYGAIGEKSGTVEGNFAIAGAAQKFARA